MKTFFTKIVPFFLFASLFTYDAPMTQSQPNFAAGGQISQDGKVHVPFVGDLTENELEKMNAEVETFLKGLSPKEYEEFMGFAQDLAEELIEKYPEELFPQAPMPSGKAPATSTTQKAPAKESSKIEKSPAAPLKNTNNTLDVKTLLESILQKTASVRQKSVSDPTITTFDNLHNKLVDMVFYLKVIQQDKHIGHLKEEEFKALYDNLQKLNSTLDRYEPLVIVPDDPEAKITKYEKEQSKQALSNITFAYENAFKKNLIEDLEKLVKKYEPIALEKKKQFEAEEKKATARKPQQAKSSPIVRRPDYSKTPYGKSQYGKSSYGDYSSYYDDYGNYPYNSYYDDYNYDSRPYKKKDSSSPQGGITKPTEKPKEKEIDPEEIKESKKLKKHIKEIYREFVEDFEKLEETLEDNKDLMDKFRSYLGTIGDPSPDYNTLFNELVARLQSIRNQTRKFIDELDDTDSYIKRENSQEFEKKYKDDLEKLRHTFELIDNFESMHVPKTPEKNNNHKRSINRFKREKNKLEKNLEKINNFAEGRMPI